MEINKNVKFNSRQRIQSFGPAFKGLKILLRYEHNSRIHLAATILVVIAGIYLEIKRWEWVALLLSIGAVFSAELLNSAIEYVVDLASPDFHKYAGYAKDLAAGAVLITAIIAVIIGGIIFWPYITTIYNQ